MNDKDRQIEKLEKRIRALEKTIQIITGHSGRLEKDLRHLFESVSSVLPAPLIIARKSGEIQFVNDKAKEVFGGEEEDYKNFTTQDFYTDPGIRERFLAQLVSHGEVTNFTIDLKTLDGRELPASIHAKKISFEGHEGILTIIHDLTEIRREEEKRLELEKQLRQTQKMEAVGAMAAGIAHDFNNILTAIFGRLQLASVVLPDCDLAGKHIQDALKAAERAKDITAQILAFCRPKSEENEPFQIDAVISDAFKMVRSIIQPNIELELCLDASESIIMGNPAHVQQVLINLANNAGYVLKDAGGKIEIRLEKVVLRKEKVNRFGTLQRGNYMKLSVRDNGPGIAEEQIDMVFDPFYTTKPVGEGTGMGLAVVHGIMRSCGGSVEIETSSESGTVFCCYFPFVPDMEIADDSNVSEYDVAGSGYGRVLLVDDEPDILETYKELLTKKGYEVATSSSGLAGLQTFSAEPDYFDLIITDHSMPEMSGGDMVKKIKQIRKDIPVVIITGGDDTPLLDLDTAALIRKPFSTAELESAIRLALKKL